MRNIHNCMVTSIPRTEAALNFLVNAILICYIHFSYLYLLAFKVHFVFCKERERYIVATSVDPRIFSRLITCTPTDGFPRKSL